MEYDAGTATWSMTPGAGGRARPTPTARPSSPGACSSRSASCATFPQIEERFRTGAGFGWHEHDGDLFAGTERSSGPATSRTSSPTWLPALDGVVDKLEAGAEVADVGCGHGASTILMAQAFPTSRFVGIDYHEASIVVARRRAERGRRRRPGHLRGRRRRRPARGPGRPGHDVRLPARHGRPRRRGSRRTSRARRRTARSWSSNRWPATASRTTSTRSAASSTAPRRSSARRRSLAQPGQRALGPQAGPAVLTSLLRDAGFGRVRVATTSPVNLVLEARP